MNISQTMSEFFREGGTLSGKFPNFEYRHQQLQMSEAIYETLSTCSHLLVEAPTGIGKSFAYLVPSILFAKEASRKVIVSTYSINLQEQLIDKDIPLLKNTLPFDFKAGLLKGRNNYLCPRRLARALEHSNTLFETSESAQLNKLYDWSKRTKDGTLSDIDFEVSHEVWDTVCSERGICTMKTCGGEKTKCFFQKARMELEKCDVIILNHHLFFTLYDGVIEGRNGYLYSNDLVIFDEAHTVEQVAADHISPAVSRDAIRYNLLRLYNSKKKRGFLLELPSLHLQMQVQNLLELNQYFFHRLRRELFHAESGKLNGLAVRIYEKDFTDNELSPELKTLIESLRELRPACTTDSQTNELNEFVTRFSEIKGALDSFITQKDSTNDNEYVYWAELSSSRPESNMKLCSSPVDLSGYFRTNIFKKDNTAILTSATLTTGNSFDYFNKRLGAEEAGKLILDSPFDYSRQVRLYVPKDIPPPVNDSDEVYLDSLKEWLMYFVDMTGGKALVLFTNRTLLRRVGEDLKHSFAERSIDLLMQGEGRSRKMLLEKFRSDVKSVLFGLDSFWMGVDVPGESLSNLIIVKLPFQVPSHPLVQARIEFIEKNGGNSFIEYSLPEAVLKFRQGVGRLIRNSNDKGIIAILDNRVITRPYGKTFLNSIDECPLEIIGSDDIPVIFRQ